MSASVAQGGRIPWDSFRQLVTTYKPLVPRSVAIDMALSALVFLIDKMMALFKLPNYDILCQL